MEMIFLENVYDKPRNISQPKFRYKKYCRKSKPVGFRV